MVKWTSDTDAVLLAGILEYSQIPIHNPALLRFLAAKITESLPSGEKECTPKAVSHRLTNIKSRSKAGGDGDGDGTPTPKYTPTKGKGPLPAVKFPLGGRRSRGRGSGRKGPSNVSDVDSEHSVDDSDDDIFAGVKQYTGDSDAEAIESRPGSHQAAATTASTGTAAGTKRKLLNRWDLGPEMDPHGQYGLGHGYGTAGYSSMGPSGHTHAHPNPDDHADKRVKTDAPKDKAKDDEDDYV